MSLSNTLRVMPVLLRTGLAESVAYRGQVLVWMLSAAMPLIMMAVWSTVARDVPVGRFDEEDFQAYFLAVFIVRQMGSAWAAFTLNRDVRTGALSMMLLRPVHPLWRYAAENVSALPMRLLVAVPVAVLLLATVGTRALTGDWLLWALWPLAMFGGWLISFLTSALVGCLCFFIDQSLKVMQVVMALGMVFSGYLFPVALFPPVLAWVARLLPFRYQLGFPVELMLGLHDWREALVLLGCQWAYVLVLGLLTAVVWRRGLARFSAYGG